MKAPLFALLVTAFGAACLTGCGSADFESEAAYPPPPQAAAVGYTPPSEMAQQQPAYAPPAPPPMPAPPQARQGEVGDVGDVAVDGQGAPPAEAGYGPDDQYAETDPSALTDFRSTLDPYGSWVDDPTYGTVWVPSSSVVGSDFAPYVSAGHWTYDDDYTWVSDYDWGWAPFHYGRWAYASPYGWEWVPGRSYAGAWVSWRYGGEYVGWAPLGPTWGWRGGYAFGLGYPGAMPYAFCGSNNLFAPRVGPVLVQGSMVGTVGAGTRPWVGATPSVNGHVAATPHVGGPPPSVLNIPSSVVAHGAVANRGIQQARAFSHPSTATAMGAHAPQAVATRGGVMSGGRSPVYGGGMGTSHFGGKLGSGFRGSAGSARPYYGGGYSGGRPYYGGSSGARPYGGAYGGSYGGGYRGGAGYGAPGGAHVPSGQSSGHKGYSSEDSGGGYHSGGHVSGGGYHGGGGGGFHGGGGGGGGGRGGHR